MISKCGCCEAEVEDVHGEFICECGTQWKMGVGRKKDLFKKRPSWWTRNKAKVDKVLMASCVIIPLMAAVILVAQTGAIGG